MSAERLERQRQTNCQQEPAYHLTDTVVFSIRDPHLTAHHPGRRCVRLEPHPITECGEWANE